MTATFCLGLLIVWPVALQLQRTSRTDLHAAGRQSRPWSGGPSKQPLAYAVRRRCLTGLFILVSVNVEPSGARWPRRRGLCRNRASIGLGGPALRRSHACNVPAVSQRQQAIPTEKTSWLPAAGMRRPGQSPPSGSPISSEADVTRLTADVGGHFGFPHSFFSPPALDGIHVFRQSYSTRQHPEGLQHPATAEDPAAAV